MEGVPAEQVCDVLGMEPQAGRSNLATSPGKKKN